VGRNRAVAQFGAIHIAGFLAWFVWVFVHLMYLVEFENRLLVFVEWSVQLPHAQPWRAAHYRRGSNVRSVIPPPGQTRKLSTLAPGTCWRGHLSPRRSPIPLAQEPGGAAGTARNRGPGPAPQPSSLTGIQPVLHPVFLQLDGAGSQLRRLPLPLGPGPAGLAQMWCYGRVRDCRWQGACGALLVFASPVVGCRCTSAYNDVAVAAIAFTLFHLLQIWGGVRAPRLLVAIGLVGGSATRPSTRLVLGSSTRWDFVAWKSRRRIRETAIEPHAWVCWFGWRWCTLSYPGHRWSPGTCRYDAWHLSKVPWREALRIKPEERGSIDCHETVSGSGWWTIQHHGADR